MRLLRNRCVEDLPGPLRCQLFGRLLDVEFDRPNRSLHVCLGPAGLHLFWADVWKSRPDWCSKWSEPIA